MASRKQKCERFWTQPYDGEHLWVLDNDTRGIYQLAVPEPASLSLLTLGSLALVRRRKRGACK